ncbi:hypothetical protein VCHC67A1_00188B, partial [Vibrio cholerae HC-67A1]
IERLGKSVV